MGEGLGETEMAEVEAKEVGEGLVEEDRAVVEGKG